jgi:hypothetical protein
MASTSYLPASSALEHLKTYSRGDGLSLRELVDSNLHGGLTYNGTRLPRHSSKQSITRTDISLDRVL